ncbi:MAG TPA: hypothetical protein VIA62_06995 [Thermoanaerobaculia bacterium]|jgi:hypothetical protein|nr:hypothetical protein [Thermoanaerobaculia bacterium]
MATITSKQVLDGLKEKGINNLQELAAFIETTSKKTDDHGNSVVATAIINPHFFVTCDDN